MYIVFIGLMLKQSTFSILTRFNAPQRSEKLLTGTLSWPNAVTGRPQVFGCFFFCIFCHCVLQKISSVTLPLPHVLFPSF